MGKNNTTQVLKITPNQERKSDLIAGIYVFILIHKSALFKAHVPLVQ